jgi:hypothetical protein
MEKNWVVIDLVLAMAAVPIPSQIGRGAKSIKQEFDLCESIIAWQQNQCKRIIERR